jgi:hypothetical protein
MSQCQDCSASQTCTEQAAGLAAATAGSTWRIWLSNAAWTGKYRCSKLQHAGHTGLCNTLTVSNVSCTVWDYVDAGLAYVFGLDESKYQWAIDRHNMLLPQVSRSKARLALKHPCQQSAGSPEHNPYCFLVSKIGVPPASHLVVLLSAPNCRCKSSSGTT